MADFAPGLVTLFGGSGFIGSQAVRALAKRGWRIRVAVRKPTVANELQPLGDVGQIQLMRCDVTNPADVAAALRGADAVVNLVGVLHEAPGRSFARMHAEAARTIAEQARAAGVTRLVQMSAIGADADGASTYARTKGEAEAAVRAIYPDAVILRPSIVFGAGDSFLNRFASMATLAPALPLVGGGHTKFQPVYVGDVAEAIARAVVRPDAAGKTYELAGPATYSFEDILKYVLRETGRKRGLLPLPFFAAETLGGLMQPLAVLGLNPPLTTDQVKLLKTDNVAAPGSAGLADLGIEPTGLEAIAPSYLWRYRKGGQFAENPSRASEIALPA
ncbi:3-beta hydroxysteroid dehydrogenase [Brevundimonas sp. Leaf363]|uniref:complex I NDUFA9 subunit family protein n=1 Tax=Brevundimonas sp. Leaf363 TaxID=1736353 RepID=UPI0006F58DEE|nr:complex I NDUFA9 subunit family protein [Brevundimonas sp. Leaf363]KQS57214.1 3-beta hydroxysteroid dehydrogenase [Brevundimonas sp. Leaf363]